MSRIVAERVTAVDSGNDMNEPTDVDSGETNRFAQSQRIRILAVAGLFGAILLSLLLAYLNGERVTAINLKFVGDEAEVSDPKIPLRNTHLPDYKLKVHCDTPGFWIFHGKTCTLGPIPNQSATNGLQFAMASDIPSHKIRQIDLIEDDELGDDLICSIQNSAPKLSAAGYEFTITRERSLRVGFDRLWRGDLGAILVTLAVMCAVISIRMLFVV